MNGSGITPTVELATNNGNGFYPVYPMMGGFGNSGFGGFGNDGAIWIILIIALLGGFNNGNNNGGAFYGNGFNDSYAWLSNGQKEIMQNTNNGFDALHLSNQLEGNRDAINDLSSAVCNGFNNTNTNLLNGFNSLNTSFLNCCCDNKLAVQDLKATVISENCSDREVLRQIGQDILVNQTANTQKIIDEIFRDRLDEKDDKIAELNRQLTMADLRASQIAQTQAITSNIYNELKNCPIGTVPVYGSQPIFTCPNNGCGCGGFNTTSQFI